jgi:hypothetical protein
MLPGAGIRGKVASIKWAYYTAAAVHDYTVTRDKASGTWAAVGAFVPGLVDAYKMAQRPLFFLAPFKRGVWRWEIQTLTMHDGGRFAARLGPITIEATNHGIPRPPT